MKIAVSGRGTYYARQHLKPYGLRWNPGKHAWVGDVERNIVTLIRETVMRQFKNIQLVFEDPAEASEYLGFPTWECPKCKNFIRKEDCEWTDGKVTYKCPFCQNLCRLLEE